MVDVYETARGGRLTRVAGRLAARARARRHAQFGRALDLRESDRILDVGCGRGGLAAMDRVHDITGLDLRAQEGYAGGRLVVGDAREMPFADDEFDVVWCNSLIEHVEPADRPRVASEIRRVAGRWWVQTPNRWFPVEPHVLLPLFQFLPRALRRRLWRFGASGEPFHDIPLLDRRDLQALFPESEIRRERVGPLTKSLIAVGRRGGG
ncbi:MAG: class I SAM-dependent methyltransferase [Thermoleophilaceae bacterium]